MEREEFVNVAEETLDSLPEEFRSRKKIVFPAGNLCNGLLTAVILLSGRSEHERS